MIDISHYTNRTLEELRQQQEQLRKRKDTPALAEQYPDLADAGPKVYIPTAPDMLTYEEARNALHHYMCITYGEHYTIKRENIDSIRLILTWLTSDDSKGLYLYGTFGSGKTSLINMIMRLRSHATRLAKEVYQPAFIRLDYKEMVQHMREKKEVEITRYARKHLYLDDLGYMDQSQITIWGEKINLITDIIYHRHLHWQRGIKTIITSNLTPAVILDQYGEGTYSRLHEMSHIIYWKGKNHRL